MQYYTIVNHVSITKMTLPEIKGNNLITKPRKRKKWTYTRQPLLQLVVVVVIHSFFDHHKQCALGSRTGCLCFFNVWKVLFLKKNGTVGIGHLVSVFRVSFARKHSTNMPKATLLWKSLALLADNLSKNENLQKIFLCLGLGNAFWTLSLLLLLLLLWLSAWDEDAHFFYHYIYIIILNYT